MLRAFRRFRQRQMLRIGTNDIIRDRPLEEITRDISRVADVALEVALATAPAERRQAASAQPYTDDGEPARCVVLAFGKLGGEELNYSSDIDLMFVYDEEGGTRGKRVTGVGNDEFFARVVGEVVRLLSAHTDRGQAYRVDLRLRPEGQRGPLARSLASTLVLLRHAWAAPGSGRRSSSSAPWPATCELGERVPHGHRAVRLPQVPQLRRDQRDQGAQAADRAEDQPRPATSDTRGQDRPRRHPRHRVHHPVPATAQRRRPARGPPAQHPAGHGRPWSSVGCLTDQEYRVLDDAYRFLRKTEHRLQLLFDLQTHRLPDGEDELRKLALRMGYCGSRIGPTAAPPAERRDAPTSAARSSRSAGPATPSCTTTARRPSLDRNDPRSPAAPDVRRRGRARRSRRPT